MIRIDLHTASCDFPFDPRLANPSDHSWRSLADCVFPFDPALLVAPVGTGKSALLRSCHHATRESSS